MTEELKTDVLTQSRTRTEKNPCHFDALISDVPGTPADSFLFQAKTYVIVRTFARDVPRFKRAGTNY